MEKDFFGLSEHFILLNGCTMFLLLDSDHKAAPVTESNSKSYLDRCNACCAHYAQDYNYCKDCRYMKHFYKSFK